MERIRFALGWSEKTLAERLRLTEKAYSTLRRKGRSPSLYAAVSLVEEIGLSVETLITGEIDFRALSAHHSGNLTLLPERYQAGAFSKRRTSLNMLNYIEHTFSWRTKKTIMDHFQVNDAIFSDSDAAISILFPADVCEYLRKNYFPTSIFNRIGEHSYFTTLGTGFEATLAAQPDLKSVYERMVVDLVAFYEKNCQYRLISLSDGGCVVESSPSADVAQALRSKKVGSKEICAIRTGILTSTPAYIKLPYAHVHEVRCIHDGDPACRFEIRFPEIPRAQTRLTH